MCSESTADNHCRTPLLIHTGIILREQAQGRINNAAQKRKPGNTTVNMP